MDFSDITPTSDTDQQQVPTPTPQQAPPPDQKKPYVDVLNQYRQFKADNPQHADMGLPEFSTYANQATNSNRFDEGLNDSPFRRFGADLAQGMHHIGGMYPGEQAIPGIPSTAKWPSLSEMIGGPRTGLDLPEGARESYEDYATKLGAGPGLSKAIGSGASGVLEATPVLAAGMLPGVGPYAAGAVAGAETYGETGRKLPAALSAVQMATIGKFAEAGGQLAGRFVGAPRVGEAAAESLKLATPDTATKLGGNFVPSNLLQQGAELAGKQVGMFANLELGQAGQTLIDPNLSWEDKLKALGQQVSPESLLTTGISQLPFTLMDLVQTERNPLTALRTSIGQDFARRYTNAAAKGDPETSSPGFTPTPREVAGAAVRVMTGQVRPESTEGQVLKSMGVSVPEPDPMIKTKEGDWAPGQAIEATKVWANNMLFGKGGPADAIGNQHSQTLEAVVRGVERMASAPPPYGFGRVLSRDELTKLAAVRMVDLWQTHGDDLKQTGMMPDHLIGDQFPPEYQAELDKQIALAVSPYIMETVKDPTTGADIVRPVTDEVTGQRIPNPDYDRNAHVRIALTGGGQEDWDALGLTDVQRQTVGEAYKTLSSTKDPVEVTRREGVAVPMQRNIIDMFTGLGPKPSLNEEVQVQRKRASDLQIQIDQIKSQITTGDPLADPEIQRLSGLQARAHKIAEELINGKPGMPGLASPAGGREGYGDPPSADATFAARRQAFNYGNTKGTRDVPLDINDPKSVSKFVNSVWHKMDMAELNWLRSREGSEWEKDDKGVPLAFPTKDAALGYISGLNDEPGVKYTVPKRTYDGLYRVLKQHQSYAQLGTTPEQEQFREAQTALAETTEKPDPGTLHALGDVPQELFSERFRQFDRIDDPAEAEARRDALGRNMVDFVLTMSDKDLRTLMLEGINLGLKPEEQVKTIRDLDKLKAQFISYIRFMQGGGVIRAVRNSDGTVTADPKLKENDLAGLATFMNANGHGPGVFPPSSPRAGEPYSAWFNRHEQGKRGGMNFFEQFNVVMNEMRKAQFARGIKADLESRPWGDYTTATPPGVTKEFDKALTYQRRAGTITSNRAAYAKLGEYTEEGAVGEGIAKLTDPTNGQEQRFQVPYNPIETIFDKGSLHNLVIKSRDLADAFSKYAPDADPKLVDLWQTLVKEFPYLGDLKVGFAPTKDMRTKGLFHADHQASDAGAMVNPFEPDPLYGTPGHDNQLRFMAPKDILPHIIDEVLGHAGTVFGYNRFPEFARDVDDTWTIAKNHFEALKGVMGQEWANKLTHYLSRPEEMLAAFFRDGNLHDFLKSIPDTTKGVAELRPLGRTEGIGSLFDRLLNMIRNLFSRLIGTDKANIMFERVAELSTRGLELQRNMGITSAENVYDFMFEKGLIGGMPERPGVGVSGGGRPFSMYPFEPRMEGLQKPTGAVGMERVDPIRTMLAEDVARETKAVGYTRWSDAQNVAYEKIVGTPVRAAGDTLQAAQARLDYAIEKLNRYDAGTLPPQEVFTDSHLRDRGSALADWQVRLKEYQNLPDVNPQKFAMVEQAKNQIALNQRLIEVLQKAAQTPEGQVFQSRLGSPSIENIPESQLEDKEGLHGTPYFNFTQFEHSSDRTDLEHTGHYFTDQPTIANLYATLPPDQFYGITYGQNQEITRRMQKYIDQGKTEDEAERLARDEPGRVIRAKLNYTNPKVVDMKGSVWQYQTYEDLVKQAQLEGYDALIVKNVIESSNPNAPVGNTTVMFDPRKIDYLGEHVAKLVRDASVYQSRVSPDTVLDALKTSAVYPYEEPDRMWFKPYDLNRFRDTFGPAFGNKMALENKNGQWGYSVPKTALSEVTGADVSRMPRPTVKPWTVSLYDMLTRGFKQQGSDDATSNAIASYGLQFGALLKNTDQATWARVKNDAGWLLGFAYNNEVAGITPKGFETPIPSVAGIIRHEATHLSLNSPDVVAASNSLNDMYSNMSVDQRTNFLLDLNRLTDYDKASGGRGLNVDFILNPREFGPIIVEHLGNMLSSVPKPSAYLRDQLRFAPDEVSNLLLKDTLRRAQGIDGVIKSMELNSKQRGTNPKEFLEPLNKFWNIFEGLTRSSLEIAQEIADFQTTRLLYPDMYKPLLDTMTTEATVAQGRSGGYKLASLGNEVFESRIVDGIRSFFRLPTTDGRLPDKLGIWDNYLMQFPQFADKYQSARPHSDMLRTSRGLEQASRIKLNSAMAGSFQGNKMVDDARTKQVAQFTSSPDLQGKYSKIALDLNQVGDGIYDKESAKVGGDVMLIHPDTLKELESPDYINGLMDKYGVADKDKPVMQTVLDGVRNQIRATAANLIASHMHGMDMMVAKAVALNTGLMPEQARDEAAKLTQAVRLQSTDTNQAMQLLTQFQSLFKDPEVYGKIFDMANTAQDGIDRLTRFLNVRSPYFTSERRGGGYGLVWKDAATDKVRSQYWGTAKERDNYLAAHPDIEPMRQLNPQDRDYGVPQQVFNILDEQKQRLGEKLVGLFGKDDADKMSTMLDFSTDLRDALNARDILRLTTGRDLAPGREDLNMFQTHQHYVQSVNSAIKNRFVRLESELLFTSPELANQPNIKAYIDNQVKAFLKPDSPLGSQMQKLGFLYYLWGNPSSMIMQLSHQLMGLAPTLTANGASVSGSYNLIRRANQMLSAGGIRALMQGGATKFADPVIQQMMDRAANEGVTTSWLARELDYANDLSMVNRMRVTSNQSLWQPFDLLKNGLYQGFSLVRRFYDIVPVYNSRVAFLASLLHLRSQGLSGEELFREAGHLKDITMFPGGKEARPGFFQYVPRSAAQAMWSLQTYANGLTTMMGDLIRRSINPKGAGLTPAQGTQVRKAAAQMLFTQTAVAGVLGLPFAQAALYGLQKIFPQLNVEKEVQDALNKLAGDDSATGGGFGAAVTNGIPNVLSYGPDLGSRFALAGTFHVSPYSGVGWQQLVGPTGGIVSKAVEALQAGARGDPIQGVHDLMPNGFDRIWTTLEQGDTYKTESGRMLANNLRPTEIAARLIGFRPARIARLEEGERLSKLTEDAEKAQQTQWTGQQVQLMKQNRDAEVRQNIAQRVADSKGLHAAPALANDIGREFERQNTPVDPRRFGNRAIVLAQRSLRGGLGAQDEGPSNVQRMQMQSMIAQRLGLGGPRPAQYRRAGNIDQMMQMYPQLTVPQAEVLLSHAAASRPTPDLREELLGGGE